MVMASSCTNTVFDFCNGGEEAAAAAETEAEAAAVCSSSSSSSSSSICCSSSFSCSCTGSRGDDEGKAIGSCTATQTQKQMHRRSHSHFCSKCKVNKSQMKVNHAESLCADCLRTCLLSKFKSAVNVHGMILPTDKVLLAFSGGPSSRVALEFVREIQEKAKRDAEASRDRSLHVFEFGVVFVDESTALHVNSQEANELTEEVKSIVLNKAHPDEKLHIVFLESLWSDNREDGSRKLLDLLGHIHDNCGKEDLLEYLRMHVLQKVAIDNGYNKLILGSNTSSVAAHVISSTAKGQGYSVAADVHYVDARWNVPFVRPLRDCVAKELAVLCHLNSWKTVNARTFSTLNGPYFSLNSLVASFVAMMQEENPSREHTIVRTAEKLNTFNFSKLPETEAIQHLSRRRREVLKNFTRSNSRPELLCPVCSGPLNEKDFHLNAKPNSGSQELEFFLKKGAEVEDLSSCTFQELCCPSCQFQILGSGGESDQNVFELLPMAMRKIAVNNVSNTDSWFRRQIDDCVLSDDGDTSD